METIFGAEMPIAAKVLLALLIVLGLAGGVFYLVRYISASRFGAAALRGRQPRLAVIEVAGVDPRRRLVLIRRDNVEHLLMIGGPTDVVVEPNILRAVAVGGARETPQPRTGATEPSGRAVAMTDATLWPLQPEPAPRPQRAIASDEAMTWPSQSEPVARVTHAADHLAGLAAELGRTPAAENAATPPREAKRPPAQITAAPQPAATDQNLTEMAQRLEAALRHSPGARAGEAAAAKPAPEPAVAPRINGTNGAAEPARMAMSELRAPRTEGKPTPPKALYDSLEQEMASLLGRPAGKP